VVNSHYMHGRVVHDAVDDSIGRDDNLSKIRSPKLWHLAATLREHIQALHRLENTTDHDTGIVTRVLLYEAANSAEV